MPTYIRDSGVWKPVSGGSLPEGSTFLTGTLMLFQQTAAPTGWTKQTTHNNKALRVVTGTAGSGGTTNFTGVFSSRTPAGTNSAGSVSNHTLTTAQIPSHTHPLSDTASDNLNSGSFVKNISYYNTAQSSPSSTGVNAGAGGSHTHGFTNPTFTGTAMDFDVQYVDLIIARKD
jgi:microcystin-dependent protein